MSERALRIRALSLDRWGEQKAVEMVGLSPCFLDLQARLEKVACYREPVLITGESGVGKEQFAQAIYLLSHPKGRPYVSVNCPQYDDGNVTVSELFGHTRGSFTGAVGDRKGAFEEAGGGVIFLDEIGDLHPGAQAMLLRTLSTGEFKPLGATRPRSVDVRVIAATNRPLNQLVIAEQFRYDLFFRLRHFHLAIPALRERGDDWAILLEYCLARLCQRYGVIKRFSPASLKALEGYRWPGNVRQLISIVTMGYAMAEEDTIEPDDFACLIEDRGRTVDPTESLYDRVVRGGEDFWQVVYQAFMDRDLNRAQVTSFIKKGLVEAEGNHRRLLELFRLPATDYQRFMDFLRHHDLKP
jgi:DNA-binding NtrC family response regulator